MKKKIIISAAALLVIGLFVPVPKTYADGTKSYNAVAYKIVKWNRPFYKNLMFTQKEVYKFPHSLKSVDELWEGMAIDPAVNMLTGVVINAAGKNIAVRTISDDSGFFEAGQTVDITAPSGTFASGEIIRVEYVPGFDSDKPGIETVVDVIKAEAETCLDETDAAEEKDTDTGTAVKEPVTDISAEQGSTRVGESSNFADVTRFETTVRSTAVSEIPTGAPDDSWHRVRLSWDSDGEYPRVVFITSRAEYKEKLPEDSTVFDGKYSDEFFKDRALVVVFTSESSGSNSYTGIRVDSYANKIYITRYEPEVSTCDMASWAVVREVSANDPILSKDSSKTEVIITE